VSRHVVQVGFQPEAISEGHALPQQLGEGGARDAVQAILLPAISFAANPMVAAAVVASYHTFDAATRTLVSAPIPDFVIAIFVSPLIGLNVFADQHGHRSRNVGRRGDYRYGERASVLLSLVAKSLLAWQVFSGTLRP